MIDHIDYTEQYYHFQKYFPYCIDVYHDGFYIINRDYRYIDTSFERDIDHIDGIRRITRYCTHGVYKSPHAIFTLQKWNNKKNKQLFSYCHKVIEVIRKMEQSGKKCLNMNNETQEIFEYIITAYDDIKQNSKTCNND